VSIAISPITTTKFRASTTDEAFEYALKVNGIHPESFCAERLAEAKTPKEFFENAFEISADGQIAICMYFVSRAGFVVGVTDEP
jgi:hypothetical protein